MDRFWPTQKVNAAQQRSQMLNEEIAEHRAILTPPTPVAKDTPATKPATSTPASAVRELAPDGIVYLLVRVRMETDSGIISLPPGTGLKLIRPGVYTDGLHELTLTAEQVSNDVETAREAKRADAAKEVVIVPRTVKPAPGPERTTPLTPAPRPASGLGTSSGLGVSGGLDTSGSSRNGHK